MLEGLEDGSITFYEQGNFTDLCRGPHIPNTGFIKSVKLLNIAGAYWRGDEKNKMLTRLSNMMTNLNLTDMETCYKLIRSSIAKDIKITERRFGIEPEITAKLARVKKIRIYEVGISYYGRTYAEGKKINWKDGFRAIYCILKYNLG